MRAPSPAMLASRCAPAAVVPAAPGVGDPPIAVLRARSVGSRIVVWALTTPTDGGQTLASGVVDLALEAAGLAGRSRQCAAASVVVPRILPILRAAAAESGSCILVVSSDKVRAMLLDLSDLLVPTVHVAPSGWWPGSDVATRHAAAVVARLAVDASIGSQAAHAFGEPARVLVATDASMRRHGHLAGCAWVRADLMCETEVLEVNDIVTAELHAIRMALSAHRDARGELVIESDCKLAALLANAARSGLIDGGSSAVRRVQREISALRMEPQVQIRWVRGHSTNRLNEIADRLAVLTRRDDDAGIGPVGHAARVAAVIDEVRGDADRPVLLAG